MEMRFVAAVAFALPFFALSQPAAAKVDDYMCRYGAPSMEEKITECTKLIDGKQGTRANQSEYYKQRATAYRELQKCDLAASDIERCLLYTSPSPRDS